MQTFRSKPQRIQAVQYTGNNLDEIRAFLPVESQISQWNDHLVVVLPFYRGSTLRIRNGEWLVSAEPGDYRVVTNMAFERQYEPDAPAPASVDPKWVKLAAELLRDAVDRLDGVWPWPVAWSERDRLEWAAMLARHHFDVAPGELLGKHDTMTVMRWCNGKGFPDWAVASFLAKKLSGEK